MEAGGTVVQVGDGRGFIIAATHARYRHCRALCRAAAASASGAGFLGGYISKQNFIGPLGGPRDVWAECAFIDLIADIAVFRHPDNQELYEQAEAYEMLTEQATPFPIGKLRFSRKDRFSREAAGDARMLSLAGEWFSCRVRSLGRSLWFEEAARPIVGGMSGSPIILPDGGAVGMVCVSVEGQRDGGPNPMLTANLPGWLLQEAAT